MNSEFFSYENQILNICSQLGYKGFYELKGWEEKVLQTMPAARVSPIQFQRKDERRSEAKANVYLSKIASGLCESAKIELLETIKRDADNLLELLKGLPHLVEVSSFQASPQLKGFTKNEEVGFEIKFSFIYNNYTLG